MNDFTELVDLASERLGGEVLSATDDFFAEKENLLKWAEPVFIPDKYTDRGKWMDGWESRRHRAPLHDWCEIRLGAPGIVRGVVVDTAHFTGNFPESCSIEASSDRENWTEILPQSVLRGDSKHTFAIGDPHRWTHLRLHIYPDGGVARLRVFGEALPEMLGLHVDLAAAEIGGSVAEATDMFFGSRHNLLFPNRSNGMHDGWETRRRRGPGHDSCVIRLGVAGEIRSVGVDTLHFKGNHPQYCSVESTDGVEILPMRKLSAHRLHVFGVEDVTPATCGSVRFHIFPDGGVSRLRLWGEPSDSAREQHRLRLINAWPAAEAKRRFSKCCGSRNWWEQMAGARPFNSQTELLAAAERIWQALTRDDFLEAFAAHPRIGEHVSERHVALEQSGAQAASDAVRQELARVNREYEQKFGFIFLICATGKSAEEMLAAARDRLGNSASQEIATASREQLAITKLRLERIGTL